MLPVYPLVMEHCNGTPSYSFEQCSNPLLMIRADQTTRYWGLLESIRGNLYQPTSISQGHDRVLNTVHL